MRCLWNLPLVNISGVFFQNFSPQMSGGYDEKSPSMPVPGPMVGHPINKDLFYCEPWWYKSDQHNLIDRAQWDLVDPPDLLVLVWVHLFFLSQKQSIMKWFNKNFIPSWPLGWHDPWVSHFDLLGFLPKSINVELSLFC